MALVVTQPRTQCEVFSSWLESTSGMIDSIDVVTTVARAAMLLNMASSETASRVQLFASSVRLRIDIPSRLAVGISDCIRGSSCFYEVWTGREAGNLGWLAKGIAVGAFSVVGAASDLIGCFVPSTVFVAIGCCSRVVADTAAMVDRIDALQSQRDERAKQALMILLAYDITAIALDVLAILAIAWIAIYAWPVVEIILLTINLTAGIGGYFWVQC